MNTKSPKKVVSFRLDFDLAQSLKLTPKYTTKIRKMITDLIEAKKENRENTESVNFWH
jgi:hypothetical protein